MNRLIVLLCVCLWHLDSVFGAVQINTVLSVTEGDSVTLHTNITELTDEGIEWTFGVHSQTEIIATIHKNKISSISERLKNHVEIDDQTGSLIITNIKTQHTGLYKVAFNRNAKLVSFIFKVIVYARLPIPVITRDCSSSSSSSNCSVLCSVVKVSHDVSVSWYKGKSLLSSISVSDLNIRLSLPLEVEYQDTNTYRCVVNNPITNLTQHLHITQLCHTSAGSGPMRIRDIAVISCAVVGSLMIVISVLIFWIRRKHKKTNQKVQTDEEEITYVETTFNKRHTNNPRSAMEEDVVYAGVMRR
ncbi:natural killer cell receptor 2B4-like [Triplophysa dalaica]|uniref:natural killer cell receptor 2B4-like n=1 Tax=Triplophysa dalaica TaxID=1582913 RepID=UPI0024DF9A49|nr:natural killer cell receptor 2B4-like [Triplophysa dalaica]